MKVDGFLSQTQKEDQQCPRSGGSGGGSAGAQAARRLTQHSAPRTAMQCELRGVRFSVQTVSASQFHKNTPQQRV